MEAPARPGSAKDLTHTPNMTDHTFGLLVKAPSPVKSISEWRRPCGTRVVSESLSLPRDS